MLRIIAQVLRMTCSANSVKEIRIVGTRNSSHLVTAFIGAVVTEFLRILLQSNIRPLLALPFSLDSTTMSAPLSCGRQREAIGLTHFLNPNVVADLGIG